MNYLKKYLWCKEFKSYLARYAKIEGKELESCYKVELETYTDKDQLWQEYTPKDAVIENLSCWTD